MDQLDLSTSESASPRPRILLTDTNRWPVVARLAIAFRSLECDIAVLCRTPAHPVQKVSGISCVFHYAGHAPLESLRKAIETFHPDIIVPSCDRGVQHLHELHATSRSSNPKLAELIERSIGSAEGFPITSRRRELLELAQSEGILVPKLAPVEREADLREWNAEPGTPWVMKADGTWGGQGVRFVNNADEAREFFLEYGRHASVASLMRKLLFNRDWDWVMFDWYHSQRPVIAQTLIKGRPANCAVVCWQGKVLAGIAVEVVKAKGTYGPATLVHVVPGTEMMEAAGKIARRLRITGFFGLDFMIENGTGAVYLIEMNPRCTPPCPLSLGKGRNLVAALWSEMTGQPAPSNLPEIEQNFIAYFPKCGKGNGTDVNHHEPIHLDVPADEPELIRELLHPLSGRNVVGQLIDRMWRKQNQEPASVAVFKEKDNYTKKSVLGTLQ